MKAPPFAYTRAASVDDALALLAEAGPDAKLLAGGQSLVPLLAYRVARPSHLIDIDRLDELGRVDEAGDALHVGALVRHAALERGSFAGRRRLLAEAAALVGHLPVRTRGTIGGSLAHADPAAELPVALLALDAQVEVRSAAGGRVLAVGDLLAGPFATALEPDELVHAVVLPPCADRSRGAFAEFSVRAGDFALAAAAVAADVEDGRLRDVRVALGGVDATAIRSRQAERVLEGAGGEAFADAAAAAAAECDPASDHQTTAAYRRRLVERLVREALDRVAAA